MIYIQSFLGLIFVLGLVGALYIVLDRLGNKIPGIKRGRIRVIEAASLGERRKLFLVEVHRECFLVAASGQHVSLLSVLKPVPESAIDEEDFELAAPGLRLSEGQAETGA